MEAAEQGIVSKQDELVSDGLVRTEKRILEVLRKAKVWGDRHMTIERMAQELGAYGHAVPGIRRGVDALSKKGLVIERIDPVIKESCYVISDAPPKSVPIHRRTYEEVEAIALKAKVKQLYEDGLKYGEISRQLSIPLGTVSTVVCRLIAEGQLQRRRITRRTPPPKPKETSVLEGKQDKRHCRKTADKYAKVKQLYEEGKTYEQMSEEVGIPKGTVASVLYRMIKDGKVKRRDRVLGVTASEPKRVEVEIQDSEDEGQDDEPEVLKQAQPDVAEILKVFENGANEIRRMGWQVDVQVKLSYPVAIHRGAS